MEFGPQTLDLGRILLLVGLEFSHSSLARVGCIVGQLPSTPLGLELRLQGVYLDLEALLLTQRVCELSADLGRAAPRVRVAVRIELWGAGGAATHVRRQL